MPDKTDKTTNVEEDWDDLADDLGVGEDDDGSAMTRNGEAETAQDSNAPDTGDGGMDEAASDEPEEPAEASEEEDDGVDPDDYEATYTVQRGMEGPEGQKYGPGDTFKVRCDHCAMWERPIALLNDKPFCSAGQMVEVKVGDKGYEWRMAPDRYSCRTHFVPLEMENVPDLLVKNYGALLGMKWAAATARASLKLQARVRNWFDEKDPDGDWQTATDSAVELACTFCSNEQLDFVQPLLNNLVTRARKARKAKKQRKKRAPRQKTNKAGAVVQWLHTDGETTIQGWIVALLNRKRKIRVMVGPDQAHLVNPEIAAQKAEIEATGSTFQAPSTMVTYSFDDWKAMNPAVVEHALAYDMSEEAEDGGGDE